jgi:hypothetical protein
MGGPGVEENGFLKIRGEPSRIDCIHPRRGGFRANEARRADQHPRRAFKGSRDGLISGNVVGAQIARF